MARAASMRAARAMPAAISTASSRAGLPRPRLQAVKEFGVDSSFSRSADDEPLYRIEPVAPSAVNAIVALGGVCADEGAGQQRIAEQDRRQRLGTLDPAYRGATAAGCQLPRRRSSERGAAQRSGAGGFRWRAASAFCRPTRSGLQVAEGRRAQLPVGDAVSVGRLLTEFVELQQVATRKQIQIMSEHTRCPVTKPKLLAYVGDDAASTERYRADILGKAQIGVRSAGGASGLRIAVPRLSRNAVAAGAALLFDLVLAVGRSLALQRHRRRGRRRPPVRDAASTKASARIISPAAAPARPSTPRCAKPRPASGCPTMRRCRSS